MADARCYATDCYRNNGEDCKSHSISIEAGGRCAAYINRSEADQEEE